MTTDQKDTWTEKNMDERLNSLIGDDAPEHVHERCAATFSQFEAQLGQRIHTATPRRRLFRLRPSWAGGGIVFTILIIAAALLLTTNARLSWADVANSFRSVKFFSATIFVTENPVKPPQKFEVWRAHDGKIRLHFQGLVFFGEGGQLLKVFHVDDRGREADLSKLTPQQKHDLGISKPLAMLKTLGSMQELSIDRMLDSFSGQKTISPPLPNSEASIGTDMQVFDVTSNQTPQWMRIWALKSSGLPVRFRNFDPRNGDSIDVLFEYMKEQPAEAFDPDAFQKAITRAEGNSNRVYALLKDPGGLDLNPGNLFEKTGYHVPEIKRVGRTAEGVVWVESIHSRNRTPDGRSFEGFGKISDNLGQEYIHRPMGHQVRDDLAVEYYVPLNYRLEFQKPTSYTLTCWTQPDVPYRQTTEIIGSVELTTWDEGAPVPNLFGNAPDADKIVQIAIKHLAERGRWDDFDKLLAMIPGEPENNSMALFREEQRLHKLVEMDKRDEVFGLAGRLYPIIKGSSPKRTWSGDNIANPYIIELVRRGKTDPAAEIIRQCIEAVRSSRDGKQMLVYYISNLYSLLRNRAQLSPPDIVKLFPAGVLEDTDVQERIQAYSGRISSTGNMKNAPEDTAWRKYLEHVVDIYKSKPLPADLEFLTGADAFDQIVIGDFPGRPEYLIYPIPASWEAMLRSEAYNNEWDPRLIRVDPKLITEIIHAVCIIKKLPKGSGQDTYHKALTAYMQQAGVEIVETPVQRKVWVAHYDGRKLPFFKDVKPLEMPDGSQPRIAQGGTQSTARSVLEAFMDTVNESRGNKPLTDSMIYIVDETGLPQKPGENQTWTSIALCYEYKFWTGTEAANSAKAWFKSNFGITFTEEARTITFHEIRKKR